MDVVTKLNGRLFQAVPSFGARLVLAQRAYMKANTLVKKQRVATTVYGSTMECRIDDNIDRRIYFFGVWEPNLTHFMERTIKQGDVVVDVGANIGYFTLLMSRLAQKEGSVVAIEASPSTFSKLTKNIERNHCNNVIARQVAVSDHKGEIALFSSKHGDKDTGKIATVEQPGATVLSSVACDTLVNILSGAVSLDRVSFIKLDIEGAEAPLLAEIIENRDRFAARFVLVSEIADANMGYVSAFRKHGFQCYFLENDYSYEGYLGALGGKESEFGRLKPLGIERERPPTADLVFVYDRAAKT